MSMTFEVKQSGGPPAGFYKAKFVDVESTEHDEYGAGLKFVFEIVEGDHAGENATRITGASPTLKNAAGRMVSGISGSSLTAGAKIDLAPFVGRQFLLQVEETPSGTGTRVSTVMPNGPGTSADADESVF